MSLFVVPFSVFFACCLAQFLFVKRVRQALATRHPEIWRRMSAQALFVDQAVSRFAWRRGDKGLEDPALTRSVRQLRWLSIVAYTAWGLCAVAMFAGAALRR